MILELALKIALNIFSYPFKLLIIISSFFFSFAIEILNWVLSGNFIPFPDTIPGPCTGSPCAGNPIIEIGWTLTRDLANMLFIVILVYMGIRTALRLGEEYKVQKLLPRMIIIALLINFTPVIAGIFVDASNILMNFFIGNLGGFNDFFRVAGSQVAILDQNFRSGFNIFTILPIGFQGILLGIINFLSAAVILLFAILFLMRHVAIWTLVILSPIAFAGYILPETRGWWRTWWHQFLQWCFIGVTAGFFLYLGNHMLILMPALIRSTPPVAAGDWWNTSMENFLIAVMPFGISLIFLWIGLFMGFAGSAMGASAAIGFVQKQSNTGLARARKVVSGAPSWIANRRAVQQQISRLESTTGKALGKAYEKTPSALKWVTSPIGKAGATLVDRAAERRAVKAPMPKALGAMTSDELKVYGLSLTERDRIRFNSKLIEEGKYNVLDPKYIKHAEEEAEKFAHDPALKKEVERIFNANPTEYTKEIRINMKVAEGKSREDAVRDIEEEIKKEREFLDSNPELKKQLESALVVKLGIKTKAEDVTVDDRNNLTDNQKENYLAQVAAMKSLKPADMKNLNKKVLESGAFQYASQSMRSEHFQNILETHGEKGVQNVMKGPLGLNGIDSKEKLLEFYKSNPRLARWFIGNQNAKDWRWEGLRHVGDSEKKFFEEAEAYTSSQSSQQRCPTCGAAWKSGSTCSYCGFTESAPPSAAGRKRTRGTRTSSSIPPLSSQDRIHLHNWFYPMSIQELEDYGKTASAAEKKSFYDLTGKNSSTILNAVTKLRGSGDPKDKQEADEIEKKYNYVMSNFK